MTIDNLLMGRQKIMLEYRTKVSEDPKRDSTTYITNITGNKNNLPLGTIWKTNPEIKKGIVIIIGQIKDDDWKFYDINIENAIEQFDKQNILYLNFSDNKNFSLKELKEELARFAEYNEEISIISGIHGFHILPFSQTYELCWGNEGENEYTSYISHFLGLKKEPTYVNIKDYFQTINEACQSKLTHIWQSSCQGNQAIKEVEDVLPKGVALYTESDGFVMQADILLHELVENTLKVNKEVDFDTLLAQEFNHFALSESNTVLNYNPIKTIIGEKEVKYSNLIDNLLHSLDEENIPQITQEIIKSSNNKFFLSEEKIKSVLTKYVQVEEPPSVENCFAKRGTGSYVWEVPIKYTLAEIGFDITLYDSPFEISEECPLETASDYAALHTYIALLGEENLNAGDKPDML